MVDCIGLRPRLTAERDGGEVVDSVSEGVAVMTMGRVSVELVTCRTGQNERWQSEKQGNPSITEQTDPVKMTRCRFRYIYLDRERDG